MKQREVLTWGGGLIESYLVPAKQAGFVTDGVIARMGASPHRTLARIRGGVEFICALISRILESLEGESESY